MEPEGDGRRAMMAILPEATVHRVKKSYYAHLLKNAPDDWRETDARVVRELVQTGDSVIDIGASIGGYTKLLSSLVASPAMSIVLNRTRRSMTFSRIT